MPVGAGRGEVRVPQLALDQRQRNALMQQLDRVRMPKLVGREAPTDPRLNRHLVKLEPVRAGRLRVSARGSGDHAEQRADRQRRPLGQPRSERRPSPCVHADLTAAIVRAMPDQNRPAAFFQIGLGERERLVDPQPARHSTTINPFRRLPYRT